MSVPIVIALLDGTQIATGAYYDANSSYASIDIPLDFEPDFFAIRASTASTYTLGVVCDFVNGRGFWSRDNGTFGTRIYTTEGTYLLSSVIAFSNGILTVHAGNDGSYLFKNGITYTWYAIKKLN